MSPASSAWLVPSVKLSFFFFFFLIFFFLVAPNVRPILPLVVVKNLVGLGMCIDEAKLVWQWGDGIRGGVRGLP